MTLLAWPALLMLLTGVALVVLATWSVGSRRRDVGTLLIWKRVAARQATSVERRRSYDLLLWLSLAAVLVGALAAARPALMQPEALPRVAVYIEPTGPGGQQLDLAEVQARARAEGAARYDFFMPAGGSTEGVATELPGGPIHAQLAQFERASGSYDARLLFLNEPSPAAADMGRVLPRVTRQRQGVVYGVSTSGDRLILRRSLGDSMTLEGAELLHRSISGREEVCVFRPLAQRIVLPVDETRSVSLRKRRFIVGVGTQWRTPAHRALYEALEADAADGEMPDVWLGSEDRRPGIRVNMGERVDLTGAVFSYDPQHLLFTELRLDDFDWVAGARAMAPDPETRPILRAIVNDRPVGDIVRVRGDVLEFAADPFTESAISSAALLLDNAIGVLTGERPSERDRYELTDGDALPERRAALADVFEPVGELDLSTAAAAAPTELSTWLMLLAALAATGAAWVSSRRRPSGSDPRQP